jgi:hypothetical protein
MRTALRFAAVAAPTFVLGGAISIAACQLIGRDGIIVGQIIGGILGLIVGLATMDWVLEDLP